MLTWGQPPSAVLRAKSLLSCHPEREWLLREAKQLRSRRIPTSQLNSSHIGTKSQLKLPTASTHRRAAIESPSADSVWRVLPVGTGRCLRSSRVANSH